MRKLILLMLGCVSIFTSAYAETDIGKLLNNKMDQVANYLDKTQNTPKAWETMIEVANIIKQHPNYDDGEYAEGMNDMVTQLLIKPWKYASPYLIGTKGSPAFRKFVVDHINELSSSSDLKIIKKNINKNCNQAKYSICQRIIIKINKSISSQ